MLSSIHRFTMCTPSPNIHVDRMVISTLLFGRRILWIFSRTYSLLLCSDIVMDIFLPNAMLHLHNSFTSSTLLSASPYSSTSTSSSESNTMLLV
uniref:Uncharacterized protein n=1 Tax=Arundo donax TaxID=35708 RepID=A0A0A9B849_ARUDO